MKKQTITSYWQDWRKKLATSRQALSHRPTLKTWVVLPRFHRRDFVTQDLQEFATQVDRIATGASLTVGVVTDTHAKAEFNPTYYGWNGLQHVSELNQLDDLGILDVKGHLGDMIDGSDEGPVSAALLGKVSAYLSQGQTPYFIAKGNHDENDKYDEKITAPLHPSFGEHTYDNHILKHLLDQSGFKIIDPATGTGYLDKGTLRILVVNTCDVPYVLQENGLKKYDHKRLMGLRQQQVTAIAQLLAASADRQLVVFGHADLVNRKRRNSAVNYNGRALHELLVAFNRHLAGRVQTRYDDATFELDVPFDFSKTGTAQVWAYVCGHRHVDTTYQVDGLRYILLNCSALMGRRHKLTTRYNRLWDRHYGNPTEYAGYVLDLNAQRRQLTVMGYGAATAFRQFQFH